MMRRKLPGWCRGTDGTIRLAPVSAPPCVTGLLNIWCRRRDLNPHGLRHTPSNVRVCHSTTSATEAFSVGTLGPVCTHASQSVDGPPCNVDVGPQGSAL